jgi:NAD(P)-dependent dehydrogenase (short-subunit alcohol dehydrogenase family)
MPDLLNFALTGQVAVVTGAAGLLGRQHVDALAQAGATVVAVDLDARRLAEGPWLAGADEGCVVTFPADVTSEEALRRLLEYTLAHFGRIDVLVNNAAIDDKVEAPAVTGAEARFEQYPLEQWRRVMDVNVTGVFLPCQRLGAEMARRGSGSIINVASTYGLVAPDPSLYLKRDGSRPFVKSPAYPASIGAVLALTRYLAAYWGDVGVRVNALAPGGVANGQDPFFIENYERRTPLGRMAAPDDYRGALVFLASDASRYMTGATLVVDGGFTAW